MEAYHHQEERGSFKSQDMKGLQAGDQTLKEKMAQLIKTREELKLAKDKAMESWLDSKPLIDQLEKLQEKLDSAKNQTSMSNIVISELESQLQETNHSMMSRIEGESEANKAINEITWAVDELREELDTVKMETEQEHRARSKLKQTLRLKKQKLRSLQLTLRAVQIEAKAYGSSMAEAVGLINASKKDGSVVKMTQEEYYALARRAKEEIALADWRVSVSVEQKLAADASRSLALTRLKDVYLERRLSRRMELQEEKEKDEIVKDDNEGILHAKEDDEKVRGDVGSVFPKARVRAMKEESSRGNSQRTVRKSGSSRNKKKVVEQKRPSIFSKLKNFLMRSISKLFK